MDDELPPLPRRNTDSSQARLKALCLIGGSFYLFLGAAAFFFVGRFLLRGGPSPLWVTFGALVALAASLWVGAWMVRAGVLGVAARNVGKLRHLAAGAAASILWAPLEYFDVGQGFASWLLAGAAFLATEALVRRWLDVPPPSLESPESGRVLDQ